MKTLPKNCPMCQREMRSNHYGDWVCNCLGPLHDFNFLDKRYKSQRPEQENQPVRQTMSSPHKFRDQAVVLVVLDGVRTTKDCEALKYIGFKWAVTEQKFLKKYKDHSGLYDDMDYLSKRGFKYQLDKDV